MVSCKTESTRHFVCICACIVQKLRTKSTLETLALTVPMLVGSNSLKKTLMPNHYSFKLNILSSWCFVLCCCFCADELRSVLCLCVTRYLTSFSSKMYSCNLMDTAACTMYVDSCIQHCMWNYVSQCLPAYGGCSNLCDSVMIWCLILMKSAYCSMDNFTWRFLTELTSGIARSQWV